MEVVNRNTFLDVEVLSPDSDQAMDGVTDGDVFGCPKKPTDVGQGEVFWMFSDVFFDIDWSTGCITLQEIKVITVCVFTKELVAQVHFVPFAGVAFFV